MVRWGHYRCVQSAWCVSSGRGINRIVRNTPSIDLQKAEYKCMRLSMGIFHEIRRSRIDETTISDDHIRLKRLVLWRQRRNLPTHLPWETSIIFVSIYVSFAFFVISVLNLAWKSKILSQWIWCIVWHQIVKIWRHNC